MNDAYAIVAKYPFVCCSIGSCRIHCRLEIESIHATEALSHCLTASAAAEKHNNDKRTIGPASEWENKNVNCHSKWTEKEREKKSRKRLQSSIENDTFIFHLLRKCVSSSQKKKNRI